jgi:transposase-like protein
MKSMRKRFDSAFKAKVALEAIKGEQTLAEIATHYGVHPTQISQWKKQVLAGLPSLLDAKSKKDKGTESQAESELYEEIGRLKVEVDWLKKKFGLNG